MNRQLGAKGNDTGEASPLSLLVHAADAQNPRNQNNRNGGAPAPGPATGNKPLTVASNADALRRELENSAAARLNGAPAPGTLEEQLLQCHAAARAGESRGAGTQGLLQGLGGVRPGLEADFLQQNAAIAAAAQQQQQAAAMALASDIRSAMAAAQLRQAAQFQNQDLLLARAAAQQQLGLAGFPGIGLDQLQEFEIQRLEELERRQLLASVSGAPAANGGAAGLAQRQAEIQEAQLRQEQLDRELQQNALLSNREKLVSESSQIRSTPTEAAPAPAANDTNSKENFQKAPGSVVVPCRARGMPMDHNFKTAYFVIPENVEHGEELICSYFACRNAGIKFRYCTHCKVPVAKRNFRKRHKHGKAASVADANEDEVSIDETASAGSAPSVPTNTKAQEPPAKVEAVKKEAPPAPVATGAKPKIDDKVDIVVKAPKIKAMISVQKVSVKEKPKESPKEIPKESKETPTAPKKPATTDTAEDSASKMDIEDAETPELPPIPNQKRQKICAEREVRWAALLAKRPPTKDGSAMSGWLMQVLAVSDLDTPLSDKPVASGDGAAESSNDRDQATKDTKASTSPAATTSQKKDETAPASSLSSNGVLVKKKRPLALTITKDEEVKSEETSEAEKEGSGGFAEWRDRKKHKGLAKKLMTG